MRESGKIEVKGNKRKSLAHKINLTLLVNRTMYQNTYEKGTRRYTNRVKDSIS